MRQYAVLGEPGCRPCAAGKHGVCYRTVVAALESAWRKEREGSAEARVAADPYHQVIDEWLRDDLDAPRKQRHTAKRIFDRSSVNATTDYSDRVLPVTTDITETWAVQGPRSVAGDRLVARRGGTCP